MVSLTKAGTTVLLTKMRKGGVQFFALCIEPSFRPVSETNPRPMMISILFLSFWSVLWTAAATVMLVFTINHHDSQDHEDDDYVVIDLPKRGVTGILGGLGADIAGQVGSIGGACCVFGFLTL